jgi:hypothetical protein
MQAKPPWQTCAAGIVQTPPLQAPSGMTLSVPEHIAAPQLLVG